MIYNSKRNHVLCVNNIEYHLSYVGFLLDRKCYETLKGTTKLLNDKKMTEVELCGEYLANILKSVNQLDYVLQKK